MTDTQRKLRQWFRRRGWSVVDNNGGCGTVNLMKDSLEIDYFAFGDEKNVILKFYNSNSDTICTKIGLNELEEILELIEVCRMELECSRERHR